MEMPLVSKLKDIRVTHAMNRKHNNARRTLNKALSTNIEYTTDVRPYCNHVCDKLYQFDRRQIKNQVKKYHHCPIKPIEVVIRPLFIRDMDKAHNAFQRTYAMLIHTVRVIASFMNRYDLGMGDWSDKASKNMKQFLSFQPTYDPSVSLDSYITQSQHIYNVLQAGYDMRKLFPQQSV